MIATRPAYSRRRRLRSRNEPRGGGTRRDRGPGRPFAGVRREVVVKGSSWMSWVGARDGPGWRAEAYRFGLDLVQPGTDGGAGEASEEQGREGGAHDRED